MRALSHSLADHETMPPNENNQPQGLLIESFPTLDPALADELGAALAAIDPWLTLGYPAAGLGRELSEPHPDLTRYLATRDGQVEGLAVVRRPWLLGAYIELFAVLPAAQGRGVGRAMLHHLERDYRERTLNLWLLVSAFNTPARRLYESEGFVPIGEIPDLVAPGHDEVLMRKVLS
jgi:ribosomal protein S18 acetylase RimI-like enzyme